MPGGATAAELQAGHDGTLSKQSRAAYLLATWQCVDHQLTCRQELTPARPAATSDASGRRVRNPAWMAPLSASMHPSLCPLLCCSILFNYTILRDTKVRPRPVMPAHARGAAMPACWHPPKSSHPACQTTHCRRTLPPPAPRRRMCWW